MYNTGEILVFFLIVQVVGTFLLCWFFGLDIRRYLRFMLISMTYLVFISMMLDICWDFLR
jgi:hypothetical protein